MPGKAETRLRLTARPSLSLGVLICWRCFDEERPLPDASVTRCCSCSVQWTAGRMPHDRLGLPMNDFLTILQPLVLIALFGAWVYCLVDALRQHRAWPWIIVLLFVPVLPVPFYLLNFKLFGAQEGGRLDSTLRTRNGLRALQEKVAENGTAGAHLRLAGAYLRAEDPMKALQSLGQVLEMDAENLQAQYLAGLALLTLGNAERALTHLEFVVSKDPGYQWGEARLAYADALALTGDPEQCLRELESIAGQYLLPEAIVRHARHLIDCGDHDRAREALRDMLSRVKEMNPEDVKRHKMWIRRGAEDLNQLDSGG
ncbi:MAG: hypothetical protein PWP23_133 [Candidatus Sumerlaeota bacterium]|nr:hypothetical protein [Candidatus Sumerlaeota bacterium]